MDLWAGTSGFAFDEWKGSFYPEDLPAAGRLRYYAERLSTVEINNTFYRLPRASMLQGWAEQVPARFRFALKASQKITHFRRLVGAEDETAYLFRTVAVLGERLGPVLFGLPPNLKLDLPRLEAFLDLLARETVAAPVAFEFRHPSWQDDAVYAALAARGCALCQADTDEAPLAALVPTASWGYLRLRRSEYAEADLARWAAAVRAQPWREAYLYFKHEEGGGGPRDAERFLALA
ncbi:MAG TPA: DUF72 domain-containing protein [Thermoanaerobaculia bacterium]|nr:DUF72 domain-containing protein [Thermoanaerobaculia bacterium]